MYRQVNPRIYAIILFFLIYVLSTSYAEHAAEEGLELLFNERTHSDWENVWHTEKHSRCRDKLVRHLFWACEKDIYRLRRNRSRKRTSKKAYQLPSLKDVFNGKPGSILKHFDDQPPMLRTRRRGAAPSITNECCTRNGCTWEEYAEYCPSNKRRNHQYS